MKKYLAEAKSAVEGSKSKEKLLEAVTNLGNALKEVQRARDLNDVKCDLNTYRLYCERAADMLDETEDKAPGVVRLVRRGLPIIDKKIKEMLKEIEGKTRQFCQESKQTPFEKISRNRPSRSKWEKNNAFTSVTQSRLQIVIEIMALLFEVKNRITIEQVS